MLHSEVGVAGGAPDWNAIRECFPVLTNKTYLNSCSYGAISTTVGDALRQYIQDREQKGADWPLWVQRNEKVRQAVATLLGAKADEIAITTSASASINAIASSMRFDGKRNKVVISDFEFPTSGQIWHAQELRGARVCTVAERGGYIPVEDFAAAIDDETLIVAVADVCYRNGARLDVPAIAEIARKNGALMLVDGYQSVGTVPFDVNEIGVDFAVGGMLKYLLGTAGIAYLYVREALIDQMLPTTTGWFAQADIFAMDHTKYDPAPTASRFESGTPPVSNCYAAEAGLEIINRIGIEAIAARIAELTAMIKSEARKAGFSLAVPTAASRHGALITLRSHDERQLVSKLEAMGIVTSCRSGNLRISPHFYNNEQDIENLFSALQTHAHLLR